MITDIKTQLIRDEGMVLKVYKDSMGISTIGVGRNLESRGITTDEAMMLLDDDLALVDAQLKANWPWTSTLDPVRLGVLENMCFNLGAGGLAGFRNMLAAVKNGDWATAAQEMLSSVWATHVGDRAQRLALQMEDGTWH